MPIALQVWNTKAAPEVQEGGMALFAAMSRQKRAPHSLVSIGDEKNKVGRSPVAENAILATFQDTGVIVGGFN
jgi:hypothetical protein